MTFLDYGCGKYLRDSIYLTENGLIVDAVDLVEQIERIGSEKSDQINNISTEISQNNYDAALLNFVLQVLPTEEQREEVIKTVCSAIRTRGYLVLSLRNQRDIRHCVKHKGIPYEDGFLMQRGRHYTFVKGYERAEVERILDKHNLAALDIIRTCDSFVVLSQKN